MNISGVTLKAALPLATAAAVCTVVVIGVMPDDNSPHPEPTAAGGQVPAAPPVQSTVENSDDPAT